MNEFLFGVQEGMKENKHLSSVREGTTMTQNEKERFNYDPFESEERLYYKFLLPLPGSLSNYENF